MMFSDQCLNWPTVRHTIAYLDAKVLSCRHSSEKLWNRKIRKFALLLPLPGLLFLLISVPFLNCDNCLLFISLLLLQPLQEENLEDTYQKVLERKREIERQYRAYLGDFPNPSAAKVTDYFEKFNT